MGMLSEYIYEGPIIIRLATLPNAQWNMLQAEANLNFKKDNYLIIDLAKFKPKKEIENVL